VLEDTDGLPRASLHRLHHLSNWKAELKLLVSKFNKAEPTSLAQSFPALPLQQASSSSSALTSDLSFSTSHLPKSPLRSTSSSGLKGKGREGERIILHCDFDAFFVSVGLVKRPDLKGKPCVVCHSEKGGDLSTSEIASPSYEARAHGVKAGMR
jgi:DNA repair protein REV1